MNRNRVAKILPIVNIPVVEGAKRFAYPKLIAGLSVGAFETFAIWIGFFCEVGQIGRVG